MRIFGKGFNFSQDGPGNRLVYHLSGCNMHCIWCSNPEGMCMDAGKEYSVDEILEECISARMMFFSGGGVTFTGGEATLQAEELIDLLKKLREAGIHTALETNGTTDSLREIEPFVDYLIMDFKHFDGEVLKRYTGISNEMTKQNYIRHCESGRQQHIRIPLVNEINAYEPDAYASWLAGYRTENTVFEFLTYHEYGKEKWTEEYLVKDGFVSDETVDEFRKTFEKHGLKVVTT